MTAKGKINTANVQIGDRIIVKETFDAEGHRTISQSNTKTGPGVFVTRVVLKDVKAVASNGFGHRASRVYEILTTAGSFEAAPIQTLWLAPDDAAGIKRAHAEALELDKVYEAYPPAEVDASPAHRRPAFPNDSRPPAGGEQVMRRPDTSLADRTSERRDELEAEWRRVDPHGVATLERLAQRAVEVSAPAVEFIEPTADLKETHLGSGPGAMTTHSGPRELCTYPDCADDGQLRDTRGRFVTEPQECHQAADESITSASGSAVVTVLENVWTAVRENHPELPEVVMVTGSGYVGSPRWGHFRAAGWSSTEDVKGRDHLGEIFIAGETLAKGAQHTLETILHEAAHVLARVRDIQDTSRQGRWHNAKFRQLAEEVGLVFPGAAADSKIGYSGVMLTGATVDRYSELITALDAAIQLVITLPSWVSGDAGRGGERMGSGRRPGAETPTSNNVKATCGCEEPRIIRVSRKVLEGSPIMCHECYKPFLDRSDD